MIARSDPPVPAHVAEVAVPAKQLFDFTCRIWKMQPRETRAKGETVLDNHCGHGGAVLDAVSSKPQDAALSGIAYARECSSVWVGLYSPAQPFSYTSKWVRCLTQVNHGFVGTRH